MTMRSPGVGGAQTFTTITATSVVTPLIGTITNVGMTVQTNSIGRWIFSNGGSLVTQADNTNDLGTSGSNRPRDFFLARTAQLAQAVAPPAGGSATAYVGLGSTAAFGIYYGTGNPTLSAAQGSLYLKADGTGIADRLWVNTNGATGWTNFVTAA